MPVKQRSLSNLRPRLSKLNFKALPQLPLARKHKHHQLGSVLQSVHSYIIIGCRSHVPLYMSSDSLWSNACENAHHRPLPSLINAVRSCCGVTVSP